MEFMQTEHLNIRRMRPEDWSDLFKYLSDPESQKYQNKVALKLSFFSMQHGIRPICFECLLSLFL